MKKYRNKITGAVIEVKSSISGGGWQEIIPATIKKTEVKKPAPKKRSKKSGVCND